MDLGKFKEATTKNTCPPQRSSSSSEDKVDQEVTSNITASKKMVAAKAASSSTVCTYRDHARFTDDDEGLKELLKKADSEGVKGTDQSFPVKLHQLLSESDEDGFSSIVSWQAHGRSFIVKKHSEFVEKVLPCCFRQSKFASFQRQLNLYGFRRITQGRDKGGYYHELFLRGRGLLALRMQRTKVKGTGARKPSQPDSEPDFYSMPSVFEKVKEASTAAKTAPEAIGSPAASATAPSAVSVAATSPSSWRPSPAALSPGQNLMSEKLRHDSLARSTLMGMGGAASSPGGSASRPSFLAPAALPTASERDLMAQVFATSSRLQSLKYAPGLGHLSFGGSGAKNSSSGVLNPMGSHSLLDAPGVSQQTGPLHLNAFNMPCNCSIPAF